ncbi:MAG: hypothetical protein ACRDNO_30375, partial [Trebonia sp.]
VQSDVTRRPGGGVVRDIPTLSMVTLVAMLGAPSSVGAFVPASRDSATEGKDGIGAVPREVLASIIGNSASDQLIARARQDLRQRVGLLLDEELLRFGDVINEAGQVDAVAAVRLYQAEYSLEAAR